MQDAAAQGTKISFMAIHPMSDLQQQLEQTAVGINIPLDTVSHQPGFDICLSWASCSGLVVQIDTPMAAFMAGLRNQDNASVEAVIAGMACDQSHG